MLEGPGTVGVAVLLGLEKGVPVVKTAAGEPTIREGVPATGKTGDVFVSWTKGTVCVVEVWAGFFLV